MTNHTIYLSHWLECNKVTCKCKNCGKKFKKAQGKESMTWYENTQTRELHPQKKGQIPKRVRPCKKASE